MHSIESIIDRQLKRWELQRAISDRSPEKAPAPRPVITISRAIGAGGEEVAARLSEKSGFHVFDGEILDSIARDLGIRERMADLLDEKTQSELQSWFLGMMTGRIIDQSDYIKSLTRLVGSLIALGEAILIGRGTNIIVGPRMGFHIRVTASRKKRIEKVAASMAVSHMEAEGLVDESDEARAHFVRKSFGADINDLTLYDLIINTDILSVEDAVDLAYAGYIKKEGILRKEK